MKHAHIIPLAGGSVIGTSLALKSKPEYIASWEAFSKNDHWCKQYYPDVPFHLLDNGIPKGLPKVDLLTCTPPCSGLSNATTGTRGCQAPQNTHMLNVAEFGMQQRIPVVLIENAPMLYSQGGYEFFVKFVPFAEKYGYSIQLYKTSTILHGLPQNRVRTFVILWRGDTQYKLDWIKKPYVPLNAWPVEHGKKQYVQDGKGSDDELVNLLYQHYGSRKNLYNTIQGSPKTAFNLAIENRYAYYDYKTPRYKKLFDRYKYKAVLDVTPTFVNVFTNALMWKVTTYMLNPVEDRFMSIRELMSMMGMPKDYPEIDKRFMNHIFQNVPVTTVKTLVTEIANALDGKAEKIKLPFMRINNISQRVDSKGYTYKSLYLDQEPECNF
jgi:site-specific DNA-cytosine methylase